jgi:hypothetical protein
MFTSNSLQKKAENKSPLFLFLLTEKIIPRQERLQDKRQRKNRS